MYLFPAIIIAVLAALTSHHATATEADRLSAIAPALSHDVANRAIEAMDCAIHSDHPSQRLIIADMSMASTKRRLWAFDVTDRLHPRLIVNDLVAHGAGSDPTNTGTPSSFSNVLNSRATSLGAYEVAEQYTGKHGLTRRLDGLMQGFNDNARARDVVLHTSNYVQPGHVGRSYGCPAIRPETMTALEASGIHDAVLWIDGPDKALDEAVAACEAKHAASAPTVVASI
jgi:hypothetical protein